ncbi:MAG: hypothetical protein ACP5VP_07085 [Candidatus Limnocylindrales bacterium]
MDLRHAVRGVQGRLDAHRRADGIRRSVLANRQRVLARRRAFGPADLEQLDAILREAEAVIPVRDLVERPPGSRSPRLVVLRHDTDTDIDNAVRFAEWEAARGYRASFYVLHTDWYYREGFSGPPTRYVLRALDRIRQLGHEIGLHNNVITVALRTGRDPVEVLSTELQWLRGHGFDIVGTAAHGDALCRTCRYNNGEVFVEAPRPEHGAAARTIACRDGASGSLLRTELRPTAMADLGLAYEANYIRNRYYVTDSHGRWNRPLAVAAGEFERRDAPLAFLIHPAWWAFQGEPLLARTETAPSSEDAPVP